MSKAGDDKKRGKHTAQASRSFGAGHGSDFLFVESPADFQDAATLVVQIPRGIRTKQELFDVFVEQVKLPDYFGRNWDALEECLRDLSWFPPNQPIAIVHEDLPFGANVADRATYLNVLHSVLRYWSKTSQRSFRVIMPASLRDAVTPAANRPR